jgi:16S rRNA processing protein RimM
VKRKPAAKTFPKVDARQTKHDLVAGRIVRPHGIHGMVIVEPIPDLIERVRPGHAVTLAESGRTSRIVRLQPHGQRYLVALEGFETRESAESLRGEAMQVRLEDIGPLPAGLFFRWQIVGLQVVSDDGADLGVVVEILSTGANDVYELRLPDGRHVLLPAISSVIQQIDLDHGQMRVHLLPGLIDPA